jgi:hypothetical protein
MSNSRLSVSANSTRHYMPWFWSNFRTEVTDWWYSLSVRPSNSNQNDTTIGVSSSVYDDDSKVRVPPTAAAGAVASAGASAAHSQVELQEQKLEQPPTWQQQWQQQSLAQTHHVPRQPPLQASKQHDEDEDEDGGEDKDATLDASPPHTMRTQSTPLCASDEKVDIGRATTDYLSNGRRRSSNAVRSLTYAHGINSSSSGSNYVEPSRRGPVVLALPPHLCHIKEKTTACSTYDVPRQEVDSQLDTIALNTGHGPGTDEKHADTNALVKDQTTVSSYEPGTIDSELVSASGVNATRQQSLYPDATVKQSRTARYWIYTTVTDPMEAHAATPLFMSNSSAIVRIAAAILRSRFYPILAVLHMIVLFSIAVVPWVSSPAILLIVNAISVLILVIESTRVDRVLALRVVLHHFEFWFLCLNLSVHSSTSIIGATSSNEKDWTPSERNVFVYWKIPTFFLANLFMYIVDSVQLAPRRIRQFAVVAFFVNYMYIFVEDRVNPFEIDPIHVCFGEICTTTRRLRMASAIPLALFNFKYCVMLFVHPSRLLIVKSDFWYTASPVLSWLQFTTLRHLGGFEQLGDQLQRRQRRSSHISAGDMTADAQQQDGASSTVSDSSADKKYHWLAHRTQGLTFQPSAHERTRPISILQATDSNRRASQALIVVGDEDLGQESDANWFDSSELNSSGRNAFHVPAVSTHSGWDIVLVTAPNHHANIHREHRLITNHWMVQLARHPWYSFVTMLWLLVCLIQVNFSPIESVPLTSIMLVISLCLFCTELTKVDLPLLRHLVQQFTFWYLALSCLVYIIFSVIMEADHATERSHDITISANVFTRPMLFLGILLLLLVDTMPRRPQSIKLMYTAAVTLTILGLLIREFVGFEVRPSEFCIVLCSDTRWIRTSAILTLLLFSSKFTVKAFFLPSNMYIITSPVNVYIVKSTTAHSQQGSDSSASCDANSGQGAGSNLGQQHATNPSTATDVLRQLSNSRTIPVSHDDDGDEDAPSIGDIVVREHGYEHCDEQVVQQSQ